MISNSACLSLSEFVWIWMKIQNLSVPKHHIRMCQFLQNLWQHSAHFYEQKTPHAHKPNLAQNGLLMAFRNSGKSTIVGLFCAWVLWVNPATRILILSADHELAKKMVRNIKRIIEMHPLTKELKPSKKEEWASDRFTVVRSTQLRDPSVLARGLTSNITGCRADLIICDDIEVPKNCDTSLKRTEMRTKLSELDYILTPGGIMLYIGTPHTAETIYNTQKDGFLNGFHTLKIPITNRMGKSNWPDRFSETKIESIKKRSGPNKFASQMMLEPVSITDSRLEPKKISFYNHELEYTEANETAVLRLGGKRMVSVSCWWDPAFAALSKGDNSVIACVFTDEDGHYYLHDIKYIKVPQTEESTSYQCRVAVDFIKRNFIPSLHLETNGIGKFLPALLRQELAKQKISCAVIENTSKQNKAMRILSAFDAVLMNKALSAHARIKQTPFMDEMFDWKPGGKTKDDGLDAVAGCLLHEPVRLPQMPHRYFTRQKEWRF